MQTFKVSIVAAVFAVFGFTACGQKLPPNTSVEAKVAIRANQLVAALDATIPEVKKYVCQPSVPQPCLAKGDADKVFAVLEVAGKTGQQLATVLSAVDDAKTATERTAGMEKARALLASISSSLQTALVQPEHAAVRSQLLTTFSNATQLLFAISAF